MNERIDKLLVKAGAYFGGEGVDYSNFEPKKFAELIVKECMKIAVYTDSGYIHPADVAGYMAAGRLTAAQMIKQHFGVEE